MTEIDIIAEAMLEKKAKNVCALDLKKIGTAITDENGFWVILDYLNVVVHIFQTEYRNFYRLEDLWADADRKDYKDEQ